MTNMIPVPICGREDWTILMPAERAARVQWPWHEWNRFHSMFHNLRPGDVLFDVGAERGDQSALYAKWIQPMSSYVLGLDGEIQPQPVGREGGIVLIEPNPVAWANIKAVWEANDLRQPLAFSTKFFTNRHVLGDVDVTLDDWPHSSRYPISKHVGTAELREGSQETTIDALGRRVPSPDAITIDIEGGELDALRGAMGVLTLDKPLVWVSIHWDLLLERDQSRQELLDYMTGLGYQYEHLGADHEEHMILWHPEGRTPVLPYDGVAGS